MVKRYQIWDKKSNIYTPVGEELTPAQWIDRYSWLNNPSAVPVVAAGLINGSFCGELGQMKQHFELQGANFAEGLTNEELLEAIEVFEDEKNTPVVDDTPTADERIAAALEYQNLVAMENAESEVTA